MALPWWNRTRELRHPRVNKDTTVMLVNGTNASLKKGSFISPVRKSYLARDHRFATYYEETEEIVADTPVGFGKLKLEDVDL